MFVYNCVYVCVCVKKYIERRGTYIGCDVKGTGLKSLRIHIYKIVLGYGIM